MIDDGSAGARPLKDDTNKGGGEGELEPMEEEELDTSGEEAGVALKVPFPPVDDVESAS